MNKRKAGFKSLIIIMFIIYILPAWAGRDVVYTYGQLQVIGNKICDSNGNPVQLKGMSSHGQQWFPFAIDQTVPNLVNLMEIDVVRVAMYVKEWDQAYGTYAGYLGDHSWVKNTVIDVIKDAIDDGIYVIVDWHVHWNPYDANNLHWTDDPFTNDAVNFFRELADTNYNGRSFKDYPNVIWEVMNEPGHQVSWQQVKQHANAVINQIRYGSGDSDNLILVPPANWAQNLDEVAWDDSSDRPDRMYSNIAYTLHFYAASHGQDLRNKAEVALNNGLAIFADEWGTGDYTGNGAPDYDAALTWVNWMADKMICWTGWNFSDKDETTAILLPGVGMAGPWTEYQLTSPGIWLNGWIGGGSGGTIPTPQPTEQPLPTPTIPPDSAGSFDPGKYYKIESVHSGKVVEVENWSWTNGTNVVQKTFSASDNQKWRIADAGNGCYKILVKYNNKSLDVAGSYNENGAWVVQYDYYGSDNQLWEVIDVGNGEYKISSRLNGRVLDVSALSTDDGANIQLWSYHSGTNQRWRIVEVQ